MVPGKLASFTVLAENPLTVAAASLKDIPVWGTLHEGRKLPVRKKGTAGAALGPRAVGTLQAAGLQAIEHGGVMHGGGDLCALNRRIAAALAGGV